MEAVAGPHRAFLKGFMALRPGATKALQRPVLRRAMIEQLNERRSPRMLRLAGVQFVEQVVHAPA